jgi:hypothetical protein
LFVGRKFFEQGDRFLIISRVDEPNRAIALGVKIVCRLREKRGGRARNKDQKSD